MKTVLITGANGFVGTHTLKALMDHQDVKVIVACRNKHKLIPQFKGEVREGDFRNENYVNELLEGVDIICNAMAWTSLWSNEKSSNQLFFEPSIQFLQAAYKNKVERIINISTTSAASPGFSSNAQSPGIMQSYWPHLNNVIKIENFLREQANTNTQVVNLRLGIFAGKHYALGLLPILVPRLKTHLVPWVEQGKTSLPIIDGRDIGNAMKAAVFAQGLNKFESFNIVGPTVPTVREVFTFIHDEFGYPKPHFNVNFPIAFGFARLMEWLDPFVPWEPLVNRSIIHLLEEVNADNSKAIEKLSYQPKFRWQEAIKTQLSEMAKDSGPIMKMARPMS